ncbi:hypothetical protein RSAG8_05168, partial [Rhizoctonia solani AG-8 WAC10335]
MLFIIWNNHLELPPRRTYVTAYPSSTIRRLTVSSLALPCPRLVSYQPHGGKADPYIRHHTWAPLLQAPTLAPGSYRARNRGFGVLHWPRAKTPSCNTCTAGQPFS